MKKQTFIILQSRAILLGILTLFFAFAVVPQAMTLDTPKEPEEPASEEPVRAEPEKPVMPGEPRTPVIPDTPGEPVIISPEKPVIPFPEEPVIPKVPESPIINYGDVNGDGRIGAGDASLILK